MVYQVLYGLFALGAVIGGFNVVARKNPINCAMALLFTFMCVAALYILHGSPFLAMIQIIVYAGAILILVVFTIMLLALREPGKGLSRFWTTPQKVVGLLAAVVLGGELAFIAWRSLADAAGPAGASMETLVDPATLGHLLFSKYLLPFEVASVLLLGAIIGAVVLTRRPAGTAAKIDAPHADEYEEGEEQ